MFAVLLVAGIYFGRHWFYDSDVESVTEYVLSDEPLSTKMTRSARAFVSHEAPSASEKEPEDESMSDDFSTIDSDDTLSIEELKALSDEELTVLAEALSELKPNEKGSSKFPAVPEGFPSNLKPVWLKEYFHKGDYSEHVTLYRLLIELWNQGDHGFVNGIFRSGKVYPLYRDVVYVRWDSYVRESPDGESVEVPYVSGGLGVPSAVDPLLDGDGRLFTEQEIMSGDYMTKFPGIRFVDFDDAGYDPATVLDNY